MPMAPGSSASKRLHLAAGIGNALEWFDFAVYGYFAADIGALFFPRSDSSLQLIVSFAVFAIGYLMRPVGSLVLGPVGDLLGRRTMLITSVVVMGICSLLIGLLPTYARWGPWAAYGLLGLRMLQGLSVGGEYTGSITLVFETSAPERRGWRGAVTAAGSIVGFVAGAAAAALVYACLPREAVLAWGWRLPFLAGAAVAMLALWLRTATLPEGEQPASNGLEHPAAVLGAVWRARAAFLRVMAAIAFADVAFYMVLVFLVQFAISRAPELAGAFSAATAVNESIGVALVLLAGRLSDRHGALRCMRLSSLALGAVLIPSYLLMQQATLLSVWLGQLLAVVPLMLICGSFPSLLPGQFPPSLRCTGFSLAYSLVVAVLGGTAPLLASWFLGAKHWSWGPALYTLAWLPACLWALRTIPSSGSRMPTDIAVSPTAAWSDPSGR
jgi:MHS family proline/betaine transporter-like MFS transporter